MEVALCCPDKIQCYYISYKIFAPLKTVCLHRLSVQYVPTHFLLRSPEIWRIVWFLLLTAGLFANKFVKCLHDCPRPHIPPPTEHCKMLPWLLHILLGLQPTWSFIKKNEKTRTKHLFLRRFGCLSLCDCPLGACDWWCDVRIVPTLLSPSSVTQHYHLMMMLNINITDISKCRMILIILMF